jgi:hypothetical protein
LWEVRVPKLREKIGILACPARVFDRCEGRAGVVPGQMRSCCCSSLFGSSSCLIGMRFEDREELESDQSLGWGRQTPPCWARQTATLVVSSIDDRPRRATSALQLSCLMLRVGNWTVFVLRAVGSRWAESEEASWRGDAGTRRGNNVGQRRGGMIVSIGRN